MYPVFLKKKSCSGDGFLGARVNISLAACSFLGAVI